MYQSGFGQISALPTAEQERAAVEAGYAGGYDIFGTLLSPDQLAAQLYAMSPNPQQLSTAAGLPSSFMQFVTANAGKLALGVGALVFLLAWMSRR